MQSLAFSADGSRLISATLDDCLVWDLQTGRELSRLSEDIHDEPHVALSRDGKYAAANGVSGVAVWEAETGSPVFTHEAPKPSVRGLDFSDDGEQIVILDSSGILHRFPTKGGMGTSVVVKDPGAEYFSSSYFAAAPDGSFAFFGQPSAAMRLFGFPGLLLPPFRLPLDSYNRRWGGSISADVSSQFVAIGTQRPLTVVMVPRLSILDFGFNWTELPAKVPWVEHVRISDDEELMLQATSSGQVELCPLSFTAASSTFQLPIDEASGIGSTSDALTIAYGHNDGAISVWSLAEAPSPESLRFLRTVQGHLEQEDYDELEQIAAQLMGDETPFSWGFRLPKYTALVLYLGRKHGIADDQSKIKDRLEKWVQDRPGSTLARLALSARHLELGWKARGNGFADTVTPEGWKTLHESVERSKMLLKPIASQPIVPGEYFRQMFEIAKVESWDRARIDALVEDAMEQCPTHFPLHQAVAELLLPRWGGGLGDSEAYAESIADRIGGAEGDAIYARVATQLRCYYSPEQFFAQTGFQYDRIQKGLSELLTQQSDVELAHNALWFAWAHRDRPAAVQLLMERGEGYAWGSDVWKRPSDLRDVKKWARSE